MSDLIPFTRLRLLDLICMSTFTTRTFTSRSFRFARFTSYRSYTRAHFILVSHLLYSIDRNVFYFVPINSYTRVLSKCLPFLFSYFPLRFTSLSILLSFHSLIPFHYSNSILHSFQAHSSLPYSPSATPFHSIIIAAASDFFRIVNTHENLV